MRPTTMRLPVLLCACAVAAGIACSQDAGLPAFPGAEGFGAGARGGTGSATIWVSTLNPDGPGSLREALDTQGPRIIKFKVAGTIELRRDALRLGYPFRPQWREQAEAGREPGPNPYSFVTVDGSSAPPGGITISGNLYIGYGASYVVLRHLRIRDNGYVTRSGSDCICITDGSRHLMVDHCSLEWARDEVVNPWGDCSDITFQWCIFQGYGPHGFGPLNGAGSDRITMHHNLFAHNMGRSPRIGGNVGRIEGREFPNPNPIIDVRNNVIYNWHNVSCTAVDFAAFVNLVGNYYLAGPSSNPQKLCITAHGMSKLYLAGNLSPNRPTDDLDEWADAGHFGPAPDYASLTGPWEEGLKADQPFPAAAVTTQSAEEARDLVLAQVGAWPRDPIDAGIVRTVLEGTGWAGVKNGLPEDFTNTAPTASAQAEGLSTEVSFSAQATDADGSVALYTWDFGDGSVGTGQTTAHRYQAPGEYVATLVAMDNRGMTGLACLKLQLRQEQAVAVEPLPAPAGAQLLPPTPAESEPPVSVQVARLPVALAPDQLPAPDAWEAAGKLLPFLMQANWQAAGEEEVDARLLHDGVRLYVRIISDDPAPASIRPARAGGAERWFYQGMEVCLSPHWGREPWFHYIVNTNGELHDARMFDRAWNPPQPWRVESRGQDDKWYLEIALPFAGIEVPEMREGQSGATCALKLTRYRDKDEILIWPPQGLGTEAGPYVTQSPDPVGYAQLVLQ